MTQVFSPAAAARLFLRFWAWAKLESEEERRERERAEGYGKRWSLRATLLFVFFTSLVMWIGIFALAAWLLGFF